MPTDTDEVALILSGVKILQGIDIETVREIAAHAQIENFNPGEMITRVGEAGRGIHFIIEGKAEVQLPDSQGVTKHRVRLKKGEVIGEISFLTDSNYSADIEALTRTTAFHLESARFKELIGKHPELADAMSQLMASRMALNGDINRVGKYQLRGRLGEGNMSTVFNAWDPELEREVAIKMLKYKLAFNDSFRDSFEREAKTVASLNHPNIVSVFEIIDEFSTRFIVMEKLNGQDLSRALKKQGAFGITKTREILSQVARALQYAHNHGDEGIVHRDIKPSNIVVDAYGNIKLSDFGIAGPPQDKDFNIEGSPLYLAPEIISGKLLDGRADIYALGVMAFRMLTLKFPFYAPTLPEMLDQQLNQAPPDIRKACPAIDDDFARFIESALSKDPNDRISDWSEIQRILDPVDRFNLPLDPGEIAVVIRFRDTPLSQSISFINSIENRLNEKGINHQTEIHPGSKEEDGH